MSKVRTKVQTTSLGLEYLGYRCVMRPDVDRGTVWSRVSNTRTVIAFQADSFEDAPAQFKRAIDAYRAYCRKQGKTPERPWEGERIAQSPSHGLPVTDAANIAEHARLTARAAEAGYQQVANGNWDVPEMWAASPEKMRKQEG